MNFKRFWALFVARNKEFFRDRAAFGWNFLFPFLIVAGFAVIFGNKDYTQFKIGVFPHEQETMEIGNLDLPENLKNTRHINFIGFKNLQEGLDKLKHHRIDILLMAGSPAHRYWVSDSSPKGYIAEKVFQASLIPNQDKAMAEKRKIKGQEIRYIDWLFPGILAMNMMFSALWGVGYVVVRYRKNGVLKRLKATPLTSFEYLSAQMFSRIFLLMFTLIVLWFGSDLVLSFRVAGSRFNLLVIFFLGSLSLTSLGLILAARGTSEEFTTGILNFISWPMMFLSEVWFSLEGAPRWVKTISQIFPLTHILTAARKVMNDGATLIDVTPELTALTLMALVSLSIGAFMFTWNR